MSSTPLLQLQQLCVSYGPVEAVHQVDLQVAQGEIVTVIGPNGAGKTTLLSAAMGLLPSMLEAGDGHSGILGSLTEVYPEGSALCEIRAGGTRQTGSPLSRSAPWKMLISSQRMPRSSPGRTNVCASSCSPAKPAPK